MSCLPRREGTELGSQAPCTHLPQACLGNGPSTGEPSSAPWLHSCCFCLGLKIASCLAVSSSAWARAVKGTYRKEGAEVSNTHAAQSGTTQERWETPQGRPPRRDRRPPQRGIVDPLKGRQVTPQRGMGDSHKVRLETPQEEMGDPPKGRLPKGR